MHTMKLPQSSPAEALRTESSAAQRARSVWLQARDPLPAIVDKRPASAQLKASRAMIASGARAVRQQAIASQVHDSPRMLAQRARNEALFGVSQRKAAVAQRELGDEDKEPFYKWLDETDLALSAEQIQSIVRAPEVKSLQDAKEQAQLDALAGKNAAAKAKAYGTKRRLFTKPQQAAARAVLEDCISELESVQKSGGLGQGVVSAIGSLAQVLLEIHPAADHTYVMLGNSPAPLMAWLQLQGHGAGICHLPLGGLTTPEGMQAMTEAGPEAVQGRMGSYFDGILAAVLTRGKPIVLVDYVSTGGSLNVTADCIKTWLSGKGVSLPVTFFGYSEHALEEVGGLMTSPHEGVLATSEGPAEKVLTKLNADKALKNVLLLKGPATLDIAELLNGQGPTLQLAEWNRVLRLMRDALLRD